jgi:solute carrier family 25 folate transporter 32
MFDASLAEKKVARDTGRPLTPQEILICSAMSKMTASIATYPHEVIRTRLQTERRPLADDMSSDGMVKRYPSAERVANLDSNQARFVEDLRRVRRGGIIYTTRKLVQKEGWSGLYRGLSVNLVRTVPNSAVTMLT